MDVAVRALAELLSSQAVQRVGITDAELAHFEALLQMGAQYAREGRVHLALEPDILPADVVRRFSRAVAVYHVAHDVIYLAREVAGPDDLNTVVHELSHASRRASADTARMEGLLVLLAGGGEAYEHPHEIFAGLDYHLLRVGEERRAEVDAHLVEIAAIDAAEGGARSTVHRRRAELWRTAAPRGGSSSAARREWQALLTSASEQDLIRRPDYDRAAEAYMVGDGAFPAAESYRAH